MDVSVSTVLLSITALGCTALGLAVLGHNYRRTTHQAFAILCLNLTLWSLGVLAVTLSRQPEPAEFWLRATFIVSNFLPASFCLFITLFPQGSHRGKLRYVVLVTAGSAILSLGALTNWYVDGVEIGLDGPPQPSNYGPVFHLYSLFVATTALAMLVHLVRKLKRATGLVRLQIQHVLVGIFSAVGLAIATNLVAPMLGRGSLQAYGPVASILMVAIFAYAMVRYQLLEFRVIVSRTSLYAVLTALVMAIFLGSVLIVQLVMHGRGLGHEELIAGVLAAIVVSLALHPVKERVQLLLERSILKKSYDTSQLLARLNEHILNHVHLKELVKTVVSDICSTVGIEAADVFLVNADDPDAIVREYSTTAEHERTASTEYAPLLQYLAGHPEPIVLAHLIHDRPTQERRRVAQALAELEAKVLLPLKTKSGLVGFMTLGEKTSGEMYGNTDMVVFGTLAARLGSAVENAALYRRVDQMNQHLMGILSEMREGVIAVDNQGCISEVNSSARHLMGHVELGQNLDTLTPQIAEVLRITLERQRPVGAFDTKLQHLNGVEVSVLVSSSVVVMPHTGKKGAMVMLYDLTRIKRLEENVQRADRLSSIGTLAAGMAHEIKNPLVSIKTFTQLLPDRYDDEDFRATFAELIPNEVERINSIVTRLLNFARPQPVVFSYHKMGVILEQVLALVENQTQKAQVDVELDIANEDLGVYGDEQQLHQVFLNLVLNAVDALEDKQGGRLAIKAVSCPARLGRAGEPLRLESKCVKVVVSDTGKGIEEQDIRRLFTPFFTTKASGCGLGLAVVHGIVCEHSGEIDVKSVIGAGTSFTVILPGEKPVTTAEASRSHDVHGWPTVVLET